MLLSALQLVMLKIYGLCCWFMYLPEQDEQEKFEYLSYSIKTGGCPSQGLTSIFT